MASANSIRPDDALPRPFYDEWPRDLQQPAQALWDWHSSLAHPKPIGSNGTRITVDVFFAEEKASASQGEPMRMVREPVWRAAYTACETHGLDVRLLAEQVGAAQALQGTTRFQESSDLKSFVQSWAIPHARLLAALAGKDGSWQVRYVDELARGFFHLGRLLRLPKDVQQGRLFLPLTDLKQSDVALRQLREGEVDESVRRLLWKQTIRIRDAFAQGRPMLHELDFRMHYALKRWWLGALEMINEIERRDYDLWSAPVRLSWTRKVQVYVQTAFGRAETQR